MKPKQHADPRSFCAERYSLHFDERIAQLESHSVEAERNAQKWAIGQTLIDAAKIYEDVESVEFWNAIKVAHIRRKSTLDDPAVIRAVITAHQSWNKASGHAFEEVIRERGNLSLEKNGIRLFLQKELSPL